MFEFCQYYCFNRSMQFEINVCESTGTIRWCVLILIPSTILEIFTPGLGVMKALNELITIIAGIFLLKDDNKFKKMYECLENTPLAMCGRGGGTACLMPYSFMAGIGFLYAFITWCQLAFSGMVMAVLQPFVVMTLVTGCQATGIYQGWKIWKSLQPAAAPSGQGGSWGKLFHLYLEIFAVYAMIGNSIVLVSASRFNLTKS
jgi:hypothetical protein